MAWAATWLDVLPMLTSFGVAFVSTICVYFSWPTEWDEWDDDDGSFGRVAWYVCFITEDIGFVYFFLTATHLFLSVWVAKSLRSVRED